MSDSSPVGLQVRIVDFLQSAKSGPLCAHTEIAKNCFIEMLISDVTKHNSSSLSIQKLVQSDINSRSYSENSEVQISPNLGPERVTLFIFKNYISISLVL